jgi:hypothetical protein
MAAMPAHFFSAFSPCKYVKFCLMRNVVTISAEEEIESTKKIVFLLLKEQSPV